MTNAIRLGFFMRALSLFTDSSPLGVFTSWSLSIFLSPALPPSLFLWGHYLHCIRTPQKSYFDVIVSSRVLSLDAVTCYCVQDFNK